MASGGSAGSRRAIRQGLDWGSLSPLRLRSRAIAEGVYAGGHRSARRGAGIEFGGHRGYSPGDDLRWLDRRSLLLHDRLLVRQFETETDRALRLVVDATASMGYRGTQAPGAKLAFASLVAAALARLAVASGDPVGLQTIGGTLPASLPAASGREAFERIVGALEALDAGGDALSDPSMLERALAPLARAARRGSVVVVLSDLLDLPYAGAAAAADAVVGLTTGGRVLVVVQLLDPDEATLPFEGTVRLVSLEGGAVVETDTDATRAEYLAALERLRAAWSHALVARGGRFVSATTAENPLAVVRRILEAAR